MIATIPGFYDDRPGATARDAAESFAAPRKVNFRGDSDRGGHLFNAVGGVAIYEVSQHRNGWGIWKIDPEAAA